MSLPVPLYALVVEEELRTAKTGRHFWQVILKTQAGNIKAFMWGAGADAASDPRYPHVSDILDVDSFEDQMLERGSIVINKFHRITKDELPNDVKEICEFERATNDEIEWATQKISDKTLWEDESHYEFTIACLEKVGWENFAICPAATHVHHSYKGGLLLHSAEVMEMCDKIVDCMTSDKPGFPGVRSYNFINKDVLLAGAILHDIGKVETYFINDLGTAKTLRTENSIGHIFYGMHLVLCVADERKTDKDFANEVLHCVASHHGLPEWGSVKTVQSLEAGILSRVDYLSSRNGMLEAMLKDSLKSGQPLQEEFRIYGDRYFASIGMKDYIAM